MSFGRLDCAAHFLRLFSQAGRQTTQLFRGADWGEGGFFRIELSDQSPCALYAIASQPTGALFANDRERTPTEAALLGQAAAFQISVPRVGVSACMLRCATCNKPRRGSVPYSVPVIISDDCSNVTDASLWRAAEVMKQLFQVSSGDGKLCLQTSTADIILTGGEFASR